MAEVRKGRRGRNSSEDQLYLGLDNLGATVRGFVPGQKLFDHFALRRVLSWSDLGVVWLAFDEKFQTEVVLKFLPALLRFDTVSIEELTRETHRSMELVHPNVMRVHDFLIDADVAAILSDFVPSHTMTTWRSYQPTGVFEVEQVRDWVIQLIDGLDYAHSEAKLFHRDLKPSHILINDARELKIADFGISRCLGDSVARMTKLGIPSNELAYMSPQQAAWGEASALDDIYALGAVLYEGFTSQPPFSSESGDVLTQIREMVPLPMEQRRRQLGIEGMPISDRWERTIAACLAKDPADRPQSIVEVGELLKVRVFPPTIPVTTPEVKAVPEVEAVAKPEVVPEVEESLLAPPAAPPAPALPVEITPEVPEKATPPSSISVAPPRRAPEAPPREVARPPEPEEPAPVQVSPPVTLEKVPPALSSGSPKNSGKTKKPIRPPVDILPSAPAAPKAGYRMSSRDWWIIVCLVVLFALDGVGYYFIKVAPKEKTLHEILQAQQDADAKAAAADLERQKAEAAEALAAAQARSNEEKTEILKEKEEAEARVAELERAAQQAKADKEKSDVTVSPVPAPSPTPAPSVPPPSDTTPTPAPAPSPVSTPAPADASADAQSVTNSLGMKFVPAGTSGVLFCIWDVRVKDYAAFVSATGRDWPKAAFPQTENDPAVQVSWDDANAFCEWLTKKELAEGKLTDGQKYRLPSDAEWSRAVGIKESSIPTPKYNDGAIKDVYPWGSQWPPPSGAGNYAESLTADGYPKTSPVGTFKPNAYGLYDMGGDVWQWCHDNYDMEHDWRTLRGASWVDADAKTLLSSCRSADAADSRDGSSGFRVVLQTSP